MSKIHFLTITLDAALNRENVMQFLRRAQELDFVFFDFIPGERYLDSVCIGLEQTCAKLLHKNEDPAAWGEACVLVKCEDTYFELYLVTVAKNHMEIHIRNFFCEWNKMFSTEHLDDLLLIDFARYIRVFLSVCKDFVVISLNVTTEF